MLKHFQVQENTVACWINPQGFGKHPQSLVFLHGSGGNSGAWAYQYAELHKEFNIAAIDLPGHGQSSSKGESDIVSYVLRLREILGVLKLSAPILIGHSLGAAIVLSFAAAHPREITGIVTVGGGLTMPVNPDIISGFRAQPDITLDLMCKFSLARENREKLFAALRKSLGENDVDTVAGDMLACSRFDLTGDVQKIEAPTLVICGTQDKMTPPASSEQIASRIPGAKLVLIEGAGHMVMMEQPEAFNNALADFARRLKPVACRENG